MRFPKLSDHSEVIYKNVCFVRPFKAGRSPTMIYAVQMLNRLELNSAGVVNSIRDVKRVTKDHYDDSIIAYHMSILLFCLLTVCKHFLSIIRLHIRS